jgi:hypothetical protein
MNFEENMPKTYACEKCARTFSQKSHYTAHQNKKNDCLQTTAIKSIAQKIVDDEKNVIVYKDWMATKTFSHLSFVSSAMNVLYHFAQNNTNLSHVSYDKTETIILFNVNYLTKDLDGSYYIKIPFNPRFDADIIDNIKVTSTNDKMKTKIVLNCFEHSLDIVSELIITAMTYVDMYIKISFPEKPSIEDQVIISYRCYMLPTLTTSIDRKQLRESVIETDMFRYKEGMIYYKGPMDPIVDLIRQRACDI